MGECLGSVLLTLCFVIFQVFFFSYETLNDSTTFSFSFLIYKMGLIMDKNTIFHSVAMGIKHWVGQKVHLDFFIRCHGKTQMNFLANQYISIGKLHREVSCTY